MVCGDSEEETPKLTLALYVVFGFWDRKPRPMVRWFSWSRHLLCKLVGQELTSGGSRAELSSGPPHHTIVIKRGDREAKVAQKSEEGLWWIEHLSQREDQRLGLQSHTHAR